MLVNPFEKRRIKAAKYLADILQDSHGQSEIAYVEGGQDQFDDTEMAVAQLQGLATSLTLTMFA